MDPTRAETELELLVAATTIVADDIVELTLRSADGSELPRWSAGAHIDLVLDRSEASCGSTHCVATPPTGLTGGSRCCSSRRNGMCSSPAVSASRP